MKEVMKQEIAPVLKRVQGIEALIVAPVIVPVALDHPGVERRQRER